jgi:hypothetical protein
MGNLVSLFGILSLLGLGMYYDSTMMLVFGGIVLGANLENFGKVIIRRL